MKGDQKRQRHAARIDGMHEIEIDAGQLVGAVVHHQFEPPRERADPRQSGVHAGGSIAEPVLRWDAAVHDPGVYDLEVDTTAAAPPVCARAIAELLRSGPGTSLMRVAN